MHWLIRLINKLLSACPSKLDEICYGKINLDLNIKVSIYSKSFDALAGSKEGSFVRSQEPPGELKGKMF